MREHVPNADNAVTKTQVFYDTEFREDGPLVAGSGGDLEHAVARLDVHHV